MSNRRLDGGGDLRQVVQQVFFLVRFVQEVDVLQVTHMKFTDNEPKSQL